MELPSLSPGLLGFSSSCSTSCSASPSSSSWIQLQLGLRLAFLSLIDGGRPDESPVFLNQSNYALSNNAWLVACSWRKSIDSQTGKLISYSAGATSVPVGKASLLEDSCGFFFRFSCTCSIFYTDAYIRQLGLCGGRWQRLDGARQIFKSVFQAISWQCLRWQSHSVHLASREVWIDARG